MERRSNRHNSRRTRKDDELLLDFKLGFSEADLVPASRCNRAPRQPTPFGHN